MSIAAILAAITSFLGILGKILDMTKKTPEQKERERLADEQEKRDEALKKNHEAIEKAKSGDTSQLEKRLDSLK